MTFTGNEVSILIKSLEFCMRKSKSDNEYQIILNDSNFQNSNLIFALKQRIQPKKKPEMKK